MKTIRLKLNPDGTVEPKTVNHNIRRENRATTIEAEFPEGYEDCEKCVQFCTKDGVKFDRIVTMERGADSGVYCYEIESEFLRKGLLLLNISARRKDGSGVYTKIVRWEPYFVKVA